MWQFIEKTCRTCGTDLANAEPQNIGGKERHPYSWCPRCGNDLPVIEVDESGTPVKAPVKKKSTRRRAKQ